MKKSNTGKIKYLIVFLLCFIHHSLIWANNEDMKKKILHVKLNDEYVFGEGFNEEKEIAYGNALSDLLLYGNDLKKEKNQNEISLSDLQLNVETLEYFDGKRYEVIVYLPLVKLLEIQTKSPYSYNNRQEKGKQNMVNISNTNNLLTNPQNYAGEIEDFLLSQDNFSEIKEFLSIMKKSGKIQETGATKVNSPLPDDANLILIDELGGILSLLSPQDSNGRINYKTRMHDDTNNYSNCKFIVWYTK